VKPDTQTLHEIRLLMQCMWGLGSSRMSHGVVRSWVLMLQDSLSDPSSRVSQSHTNGLHSSMMLYGEVWTLEPLKTEPTGLSWNVGHRPPTYTAYNPRRVKTSLWQMHNTSKVLVSRHRRRRGGSIWTASTQTGIWGWHLCMQTECVTTVP